MTVPHHHPFSDLVAWQTRLPDAQLGAGPGWRGRPQPLVWQDLLIAGVSRPGAFVGLDRATGEVRWRTATTPHGAADFQLVGDQLYAVTQAGLECFAAENGERIWQRSAEPLARGFIAWTLAANATAVCALDLDHHLWCLDAATGVLRWRSETPQHAIPLLGEDAVWSGPDPGMLTALDLTTGTERWHESLPGGDRWGAPERFGDLLCVMDGSGVDFLALASGRLQHRWESSDYPSFELRATPETLLVILRHRGPPESDPHQRGFRLVGLQGDQVRYDHAHSGQPYGFSGFRYAPETGLIYETLFEIGLAIRDPHTGERLHILEPAGEHRDRLVALPEIRDGLLYAANFRGDVFALHHP